MIGAAAAGLDNAGLEAGLEARFTARLPPGLHVAVGDRLRLGVDVARLHVFDPETGAALH